VIKAISTFWFSKICSYF